MSDNPFRAATPVVQPAPQMRPENTRPTALLVLGIINILYGSLGVCGGIFNLATNLIVGMGPPQGMQDPMAKLMTENTLFKTLTLLQVGLGTIFAAVLLVAGSLLIKVHPLGRTLSIAYSIFAFLSMVLGIALMVMMYGPMRDGMAEQGLPAETAGVFMLVGFGVGACIGLLYPIILLVFMFRPNIIRALNAASTKT